VRYYFDQWTADGTLGRIHTEDISGWLSVAEAVPVYRVNPWTIRQRIARQELRAVRIVGERGPEYRCRAALPLYTRTVIEEPTSDAPGLRTEWW
jgi:hypothetical protein